MPQSPHQTAPGPSVRFEAAPPYAIPEHWRRSRPGARSPVSRAGPAALDDHELLGLLGIDVGADRLAAAGGLRELLDDPDDTLRPVPLSPDQRHRVIAFEELARGTLDRATVHPRVAVHRALAHNAGAVVCAHNHPSGVVSPSPSDRELTRRLADALALVEVRLLDHLVIGDGDYASFAEMDLL